MSDYISNKSLMCRRLYSKNIFFFFNDTATTEIYTLSLHDALPICAKSRQGRTAGSGWTGRRCTCRAGPKQKPDRKSTRLNSSHLVISYAVFCLKKKNTNHTSFFVVPNMKQVNSPS